MLVLLTYSLGHQILNRRDHKFFFQSEKGIDTPFALDETINSKKFTYYT